MKVLAMCRKKEQPMLIIIIVCLLVASLCPSTIASIKGGSSTEEFVEHSSSMISSSHLHPTLDARATQIENLSKESSPHSKENENTAGVQHHPSQHQQHHLRFRTPSSEDNSRLSVVKLAGSTENDDMHHRGRMLPDASGNHRYASGSSYNRNNDMKMDNGEILTAPVTSISSPSTITGSSRESKGDESYLNHRQHQTSAEFYGNTDIGTYAIIHPRNATSDCPRLNVSTHRIMDMSASNHKSFNC